VDVARRSYIRRMSASCCSHDHSHAPDPQRGNDSYRRVLWAVLAINAGMFALEVVAGVAAGFAALRCRAMAAAFQGETMAAFGLWVIGVAGWHAWQGTLPHAFTMGGVGVAALLANAASFELLWAYRTGDANMRSAWICTRNDVLGNLAVLIAALGVFGTGTGWPDVIVAVIMAGLALHGAFVVLNQSRAELRSPAPVPAE